MAQWMNDMEKEQGRKPTYMQVYIRTHFVEKPNGSIDGGWVDSTPNILLYAKYNERVAQMTESQGRELSHDELNLLYMQLIGEGETSASSRSTRRPGTGNIPGIYRDNTYTARFGVSDDRKKLVEEVEELRSKNQEMDITINKRQGDLSSMQEEMNSVKEFIRGLRREQGLEI